MRKRVLRLILIALIVVSTVACDQTTKYWAKSFLAGRGTIAVWNGFFVLRYAENQGAFLSLGSNWPPHLRLLVFVVLSSLIVLAAFLYMIYDRTMNLGRTVALSLVAGGGAGNLIDRIVRAGYVTDFMNLGVGRLRTGIFNFADIFLLLGVLLLVIVQRRR